jgi:hypothetical protein
VDAGGRRFGRRGDLEAARRTLSLYAGETRDLARSLDAIDMPSGEACTQIWLPGGLALDTLTSPTDCDGS